MTEDDFWVIVEEARDGDDDPENVAARLRQVLSQRPPEVIFEFLDVQGKLMARSYLEQLWGAAYVVNGGCGDDSFDDFRGWLFARGRATFEQVLADPDSLADVVRDDDETNGEVMLYAAAEAYQDVTGEEPVGPFNPYPEFDPSWDFDDEDEMRERYPRLFALLE